MAAPAVVAGEMATEAARLPPLPPLEGEGACAPKPLFAVVEGVGLGGAAPLLEEVAAEEEAEEAMAPVEVEAEGEALAPVDMEAEALPEGVGEAESEPLSVPVAEEGEVVEGMGWPVPV